MRERRVVQVDEVARRSRPCPGTATCLPSGSRLEVTGRPDDRRHRARTSCPSWTSRRMTRAVRVGGRAPAGADARRPATFIGRTGRSSAFERRVRPVLRRPARPSGSRNGTDALHLTLRALGIGPGDEVVVPANTFVATAEAVVLAGARPRFADVDPDTLLLTAETVEAASPPTRAASSCRSTSTARCPTWTGSLAVAASRGPPRRRGRRAGPRRRRGEGDAPGRSASPGASASTRARTWAPSATPGRSSTSDAGWSRTGCARCATTVEARAGTTATTGSARTAGWTPCRRPCSTAKLAPARHVERRAPSDRRPLPPAARPGQRRAGSSRSTPDSQEQSTTSRCVRVARPGPLVATSSPAAASRPASTTRPPATCMAPYASFADGPLPVAEASAAQILSLPLYPHMDVADVDRVSRRSTDVAGAEGRVSAQEAADPGDDGRVVRRRRHPRLPQRPRRRARELVLGRGARLRSGTVLYDGSRIGDGFETGHHVVVREDCEIGDDVSVWIEQRRRLRLPDRDGRQDPHQLLRRPVHRDRRRGLPRAGRHDRERPVPGAGGVGAADGRPVDRRRAPSSASTSRCCRTSGSAPGASSGAGAVVTRDLPAGTVAFGNPARVRGRVDDTATHRHPRGVDGDIRVPLPAGRLAGPSGGLGLP